jgi:hypothetical protein
MSNNDKLVKNVKESSIFTSKNLLNLLHRIKIGENSGSVTYYFVSKRYNIKEDKEEEKVSKLRQPIQKEIFIGRSFGDVIELFQQIQIDLKATHFKIQ